MASISPSGSLTTISPATPSVLSSARTVVDPNKALRKARAFAYPKQVLYLIASLIALVSICRAVSLLYRYTTRRRTPSAYRRGQISWRRLPIALLDTLRALAFRWTVPIGSSYTLNVTEAGWTVGYLGVLFSWTFINTTSTTGLKVDPRYYANRAGTIAASQLPVVAALGMRNNLISLLTGVSFDKLNRLHRISARVIVVLVWVHAGGWFVGIGISNGRMNDGWLQCGILAASALTLLCILTVRPVRQRAYEMFLLTHLVFAFIFVLSMYFHLSGQMLGYYGAWPTMIIWGLDHFLRFLRLAVFNFGYLNPWSTTSKSLDASVHVLSPDFLRISLNRPNLFHWRPGQSAYISFPTVSSFTFESHPFTIATIDTEHDGDETSPSPSGKKLVFLVHVRKGFTKKLMEKASDNETYKIFVTGPYGSPPILIGYQTAILIAAGSGVTFTLPLLLGLIQRAKNDGTGYQRVIFVWAVREPEQIGGISDILSSALENIPPHVSLEIQINITSPAPENPDSAAKQVDESSEDHPDSPGEENLEACASTKASSYRNILDSPFVKMEKGRPNLQTLISEEINKASGSVSINVCGTHGVVEAVREATRYPRPAEILRGGPTISLYVEAYGD